MDNFFDLPAQDRSDCYEKAFDETLINFFDLQPEERAEYYEGEHSGN